MSSLNLVPNPTVMLVQTGLFLANFVVVKKLILEPYLSVYDKQQSKTVGNQAEAEALAKESIALEKQIDASIDEVKNRLSSTRESTLADIQKQRDAIVAAAEAKSSATIDAMRKEIQEVVAAERTKIPATVEEMSELVVNRVLEA